MNWGTQMTDRKQELDDAALDGFFAAARGETPEPTPEFTARLLDHAFEEMALQQARSLTSTRSASPAMSVWERLSGWLSRGALPAGLAASAAVGVWLGGWAESSGYLAGTGMADSGLALELTYRFPEIAGLLGGY